MSLPAATLFVDDQDAEVKYLCPSLKQRVMGSYYKNTWSTVESEVCGEGWFSYTFHGTKIHVEAVTSKPGDTYSVKLDDGDFIPQSAGGSYDSPDLPEGNHTIVYATGEVDSLPAFDYLTVKAGPSTPLQGRTLAVDDADPLFEYTGSWTTSNPIPTSFNVSSLLYRDTAHWATKIGDSVRFQFRGSSVALLGLIAAEPSTTTAERNVSFTYSIDGVEKTQEIANTTLPFSAMVPLFQADVPAGDHTVVFNLTDISGPRALGIDLFTYNASFPSLSGADASQAVGTPSWGPKVGIALGVISGIAIVATIIIIFWQRVRLNRHKIVQPKSYLNY